MHGKCAFLAASDHRHCPNRLVAIEQETCSVRITAVPTRTQSHNALQLIECSNSLSAYVTLDVFDLL